MSDAHIACPRCMTNNGYIRVSASVTHEIDTTGRLTNNARSVPTVDDAAHTVCLVCEYEGPLRHFTHDERPYVGSPCSVCRGTGSVPASDIGLATQGFKTKCRFCAGTRFLLPRKP